MTLTDGEFLTQFEATTLAAFHHEDHVRAAWIYLRQYDVLSALAQFTNSLKRFATSQNKPELYHETITWAFFLLIHERMTEQTTQMGQRGEDIPEQERWPAFAKANPDLLTWKSVKENILTRYYDEATLQSVEARRRFVFPRATAALNIGTSVSLVGKTRQGIELLRRK